jgi:hypothetical protein
VNKKKMKIKTKSKSKPRSRRGGGTRKIFKKSHNRYANKCMKRRIQRGGTFIDGGPLTIYEDMYRDLGQLCSNYDIARAAGSLELPNFKNKFKFLNITRENIDGFVKMFKARQALNDAGYQLLPHILIDPVTEDNKKPYDNKPFDPLFLSDTSDGDIFENLTPGVLFNRLEKLNRTKQLFVQGTTKRSEGWKIRDIMAEVTSIDEKSFAYAHSSKPWIDFIKMFRAYVKGLMNKDEKVRDEWINAKIIRVKIDGVSEVLPMEQRIRRIESELNAQTTLQLLPPIPSRSEPQRVLVNPDYGPLASSIQTDNVPFNSEGIKLFQQCLQTYLQYRLSDGRTGVGIKAEQQDIIPFKQKIIKINRILRGLYVAIPGVPGYDYENPNQGKNLYALLLLSKLIPVDVDYVECDDTSMLHCKTCGRCMNTANKKEYMDMVVCIQCEELFSDKHSFSPGGAAASSSSAAQ